MKRTLLVLMLVAARAFAAQNPADTGAEAEAQQLRQEIQRRFNERVRTELRLTDDQAAKMQATQERYNSQRLDVFRRQRDIRQALEDQLQPGVAANSDSVRTLMDARERNRAQFGKIEQDEDREMAEYLTPVQRARFQMMRQRFMERVAELRRERREQRGMMGPRGGMPGPRRGMQGPRGGRPPRP